MQTKYRLSKCYLIQILDKEGNELAYTYSFEDRESALREAKNLKATVEQEIKETEV